MVPINAATATADPFAGRQDGSLAESAFLSVHPRAVRYGLDRPHDIYGEPISIAPLTKVIRSTPDWVLTDPPCLVECRGFGRRQEVCLKLRSIADLNAWRLFAAMPTYAWFYDSFKDECAYVSVDELPDLVVGRSIEVFTDGTEHVYVPKAHMPCEFVSLSDAHPIGGSR